jgi:hypothetical protein
MRNRFLLLALTCIAALIFSSAAFAQANKFDPHDLNGFWQITNAGRPAGALNTLSNNRPPLTDSGKAMLAKTKTGNKDLSSGVFPQKDWNDPAQWCDPLGYPRILWDGKPSGMRFVQTDDEVIQFFESGRAWRDVWTDGRKLPGFDVAEPRWFGYSVGRWEGDTFVVTSNNYIPKTWLDGYGSPHSDQLTVTERYRRTDPTHLELQLEISDAKTYTAPWKADKRIFNLITKPSSALNDFDENICAWTEKKVLPRP